MDRFTELLEDEDTLVKPLTLILGTILLVGFLLASNAVIQGMVPTWGKRQLVIDGIIVAIWIGFWFYKRLETPKNTTNKIGIVIALTTENNKEKQRIKVDLIRKLNELIVADNLQDSIAIIPFKNYQAKEIIPKLTRFSEVINLGNRKPDEATAIATMKEWEKLRKKVGGHLYIYGHVTERQAVENTYFIDSNAIVIHVPLGLEMRKELTQDFINIWSRQFNFFEKFEKAGFDFTAQYWFLAAKYIIGCAALAGGDMATALRLHERLLIQLKLIQGHPNLLKIKQRVTSLMGQEHSMLAYWALNRDQDLPLTKHHLENAFVFDPKNYNAHLLKAIVEFNEGNAHKALKTIEAVSHYAGRNRTWQYSGAFLLMYLERFDKALVIYRRLANYTFDEEDMVVPQIIAFNENRLLVDPQRIQSHFILGFVHLRKSGNYPQALHHLEAFVRKGQKQAKYKLVIDEANKYLQELKPKMGL